MCLTLLNNQNDAIEKLFGQRKHIICYKVLLCDMHSIFFNKYKYQIGINKANNVWKIYEYVYDSIHVFTSLERAKQYRAANEVIISVICSKRHLVGVGFKSEAAFSQVRIRKRDYENVINGRSRYNK
jgi:hypothetical protein